MANNDQNKNNFSNRDVNNNLNQPSISIKDNPGS